jgi:23S rRNA (pseudouridine1915-N3)-methyltransferase
MHQNLVERPDLGADQKLAALFELAQDYLKAGILDRAEAAKIREKIPRGSEIWALTRGGRELTSTEFARSLGERALRSAPGVALIVGGAFGLDPELLGTAKEKIALSRMTLPHGLARLVLAEQLYRAGTILRNEPYHKGGE